MRVPGPVAPPVEHLRGRQPGPEATVPAGQAGRVEIASMREMFSLFMQAAAAMKMPSEGETRER